MAHEDLTEADRKVYEYIKAGDFQSRKWSTPEASRRLGMREDDVYQSLANLSKYIPSNIWIYYEDGGIRIVAE
jgi:hypothetical protein